MLIILAGLPGTGKTTIARTLARRLAAVHIRIDSIEQAVRRSGMLETEIGPAGYMAGYAVAQDNLRAGRIVIADAVNPLQVTRDAWHAVARRMAARSVDIELICSDRAEHRRRIETRQSDIEGLNPPDWQDVVNRHYETWSTPRITIDTAGAGLDETIADILARLDIAMG
ncbi:MAG: AAA family ATPase [Alphaproteobacteria bacterium]